MAGPPPLLMPGEPIEVGVPGDGPDAPPGVPRSRAVVVALDAGARAVTVAATGDARGFYERKLAGAGVSRLLVYPAASMLSAEALFLRLARARLPRLARLAAERRRGWFVRLDPDDPAPRWRKTNLSDLDTVGTPPGRTLLGPFGTKDAGGRFAEGLDELFELCRYPAELAKAPRGTACAYKEMGRCPAACDGSEPMSAYRSRVRAALELARRGAGHALDEASSAMQAASAATDFERAGELRARCETLSAIARPPMRHARTVDAFAVVAAGPAGDGRADVLVCVRGEVRAVGLVDPSDAESVASAAALVERASSSAPAFDGSEGAIDALGLFAHWLHAGGRERAALVEGDAPAAVGEVVRAASKRARADGDDEIVLEGGGDGPDDV